MKLKRPVIRMTRSLVFQPFLCYVAFVAVGNQTTAARPAAWYSIARYRSQIAAPAEKAFWFTALGLGYRALQNSPRANQYFSAASDAALSTSNDQLRFLAWRAQALDLSTLDSPLVHASVSGMAMLVRRHPDSTSWRPYALIAAAEQELRQGDTIEAQNGLNEALRDIDTSVIDARQRIISLLQIGTLQKQAGAKVNSFRTYLNARQVAALVKEWAWGAEVADALADFMNSIGDRDRAEQFVLEARRLDIIAGGAPLQIWKRERMLAYITMRRGDMPSAQLRLLRVVDWALTHGERELADDALATLRTGLAEHANYAAVRHLYTNRYPAELERAKHNDPFLYARLRTFIAKANEDSLMTFYWYARADSMGRAIGASGFSLARLGQIWGQDLRDAGRLNEADSMLKSVYETLLPMGYLPYIADAAEALDSVARMRQDYKAAYRWAQEAHTIRANAQQLIRADDLLRLELSAEEEARKRLAAQAQEATTRRHNLQFTLIAIAIIFAFITLLLLRSAHVSPRTLRIISFLSFILLFEFIILLADLFFHLLTHGEPWQLMLIKLVFIAGLSQVHHWLEHRLAHYLAQHEPLTELRRRITSWWHRDRQHQTSTAPHPHPPVDPTESTDEIF